MVVILSRDPSLYSTEVLSKAFRETGEDVRVLDALKLVVKVGDGVYLDGKKLTPTLVIPRFSENVLIAGLAILREWERTGVSVLNSSAHLSVAYNQLASLQTLSLAGLPIPETSFCSQPKGEETLQSLLCGDPVVIKLLDSSQGKGVSLARDPQTARSLTSTLATLRASGVTQRFYPEAQGVDYRFLVFHGQVLRAIKRTSSDADFRSNLHQGGTATLYDDPEDAETLLAIQAAEVLGLDFAGVDLLPTDQGCLVLEVNASPGLKGIELGEEGSIASLLACSLIK